jgi:hypothetical protein
LLITNLSSNTFPFPSLDFEESTRFWLAGKGRNGRRRAVVGSIRVAH